MIAGQDDGEIWTNADSTFSGYVVDRVVDVVDYALGRPSTSTRGRPPARSSAASAERGSMLALKGLGVLNIRLSIVSDLLNVHIPTGLA